MLSMPALGGSAQWNRGQELVEHNIGDGRGNASGTCGRSRSAAPLGVAATPEGGGDAPVSANGEFLRAFRALVSADIEAMYSRLAIHRDLARASVPYDRGVGTTAARGKAIAGSEFMQQYLVLKESGLDMDRHQGT